MGRGTSGGDSPTVYVRDLHKKHGSRHRSMSARSHRYSSNLSPQGEKRLQAHREWEREQRRNTNPAEG